MNPATAVWFPLTKSQRQFQYLARLNTSGLSAHQDLTVLAIRGPLDADRLEEVLGQTVARHRFGANGGASPDAARKP